MTGRRGDPSGADRWFHPIRSAFARSREGPPKYLYICIAGERICPPVSAVPDHSKVVPVEQDFKECSSKLELHTTVSQNIHAAGNVIHTDIAFADNRIEMQGGLDIIAQ
jgi:hypothetical protein